MIMLNSMRRFMLICILILPNFLLSTNSLAAIAVQIVAKGSCSALFEKSAHVETFEEAVRSDLDVISLLKNDLYVPKSIEVKYSENSQYTGIFYHYAARGGWIDISGPMAEVQNFRYIFLHEMGHVLLNTNIAREVPDYAKFIAINEAYELSKPFPFIFTHSDAVKHLNAQQISMFYHLVKWRPLVEVIGIYSEFFSDFVSVVLTKSPDAMSIANNDPNRSFKHVSEYQNLYDGEINKYTFFSLASHTIWQEIQGRPYYKPDILLALYRAVMSEVKFHTDRFKDEMHYNEYHLEEFENDIFNQRLIKAIRSEMQRQY